MAAHDQAVLVVRQVVQGGLSAGLCLLPVLEVRGVGEVALAATRTAQSAIETLERPAVAVEPLCGCLAWHSKSRM